MNLIKKEIFKPENSILNFRQYQHEQIEQFIQLGLQYLQTHGFTNYNSSSSLEIDDKDTYENVGYFATKTIKIKLDVNNKDIFMCMSIPKLKAGSFFILNGTKYIPIFFITDLPIVKKPKSSKLYSLFCPITLYFKDNRAIIFGHNIPISRFLLLFYNISEVKQFASEYNFTIINEPFQITLNYFSKLFGCEAVLESIVNKLNLLFFDAWTLNLYKECYQLTDMNLKILLDLLFLKMQEVNEDDLTFIDLRLKRLMYAETLLIPYFKAVSDAVKSLLKGQQPFKLNLNIGAIVEHFFGSLNKLCLYDITGGYSSILELKATFQSPGSDSELPRSVSLIHQSYYEKVCIISVSNTDTGKVISLVPEQIINLNYGLFDFPKEKPLEIDH